MSDYYPAVTDDYSADTTLQQIKEARAERDRLIELCQIKKAELDSRIEELKAKCDNTTAPMLEALRAYFETVPHKETKTQAKYQLLSGALVYKRGGVDVQRDDEALTRWLEDNGMDGYVKVKKTPMWGELKKTLTLDPETGVCTTEYGQVVDGLTAVTTEGRFDVK